MLIRSFFFDFPWGFDELIAFYEAGFFSRSQLFSSRRFAAVAGAWP